MKTKKLINFKVVGALFVALLMAFSSSIFVSAQTAGSRDPINIPEPITNGKIQSINTSLAIAEDSDAPDLLDADIMAASSKGDVVKIDNLNDLITFSNNVNAGNSYSNKIVLLTRDIKLNGIWTPIGHWVDGINDVPFSGTFDGQGHKISGLSINNVNDYQGFFGINDGTIEDLSVDGSVTGGVHVGGIVGGNYGKVVHCYNNATINGIGVVGGVVGGSVNTVKKCYNTGAISGGSTVGGVVGGNVNGGFIQNCYNVGKVQGDGVYVGGIVGGAMNGTVDSCYNTGNVISSSGNVGGIEGGDLASSVTNCASLCRTITGSDNVGMIVGSSYGGSSTNNYAWKNVNINGSDGVTNTNVLLVAFKTANGWPDTITRLGGPWSFQNGNLPTLKNMPGQSDRLPTWITAN